MHFTDRVVIMTGASAGIGRAAALAFAREGASVALVARSEDRLRRLAQEIERFGGRALAIPLDVTDRDRVVGMVKTVLETWGRIDILVNNAGIGLRCRVADMEPADLQRVIGVNLYGAVWCVQAVLPYMIQQRSGQIINVSSVIGKRAVPHMSAYCASKFALQAFSESLRTEVAPYNIDVIVVCPTRTETGFAHTPLMAKGGLSVEGFSGMSAEKVARIMVRASKRRQREVIISLTGKVMTLSNAFMPGILDWIIERIWARLEKRRRGYKESANQRM